ncbi:50S ribosomal protein L5 [Candidatus Woesearchaeota archaeon]|nr:MAG: 50S ribosomal protein L5 [Candidatus Woesearchaeota archaeon]
MEQKTITMNRMRAIRVEKLTLNVGAGKDQSLMQKAERLIEQLTGIKPVKTRTQKRIPGWGLRPGLPIGLKLTLRGKQAQELIPRLLAAKGLTLKPSNVDAAGNISFGIPEYIDIEGAKYDPEIGIIGLQVCITLERRGYRVKRRRIKAAAVGKHHRIKPEEAMQFMQEQFKVRFER